mmetsp:Transcript_25884/g.62357  ORF Transcript_25884/g.62357 Transcript_25884/m.62357 type:complete len:292 (+) Transcript_25884:2175-3050(+)
MQPRSLEKAFHKIWVFMRGAGSLLPVPPGQVCRICIVGPRPFLCSRTGCHRLPSRRWSFRLREEVLDRRCSLLRGVYKGLKPDCDPCARESGIYPFQQRPCRVIDGFLTQREAATSRHRLRVHVPWPRVPRSVASVVERDPCWYSAKARGVLLHPLLEFGSQQPHPPLQILHVPDGLKRFERKKGFRSVPLNNWVVVDSFCDVPQERRGLRAERLPDPIDRHLRQSGCKQWRRRLRSLCRRHLALLLLISLRPFVLHSGLQLAKRLGGGVLVGSAFVAAVPSVPPRGDGLF